MAFVVGWIASAGCAAASNHWGWPAPPIWSHGHPQPPPPIASPVWRQFLVLYAAYDHLAAGDKPPFSVWLALNGIVDPKMHHAMMLLYLWMERHG